MTREELIIHGEELPHLREQFIINKELVEYKASPINNKDWLMSYLVTFSGISMTIRYYLLNNRFFVHKHWVVRSTETPERWALAPTYTDTHLARNLKGILNDMRDDEFILYTTRIAHEEYFVRELGKLKNLNNFLSKTNMQKYLL